MGWFHSMKVVTDKPYPCCVLGACRLVWHCQEVSSLFFKKKKSLPFGLQMSCWQEVSLLQCQSWLCGWNDFVIPSGGALLLPYFPEYIAACGWDAAGLCHCLQAAGPEHRHFVHQLEDQLEDRTFSSRSAASTTSSVSFFTVISAWVNLLRDLKECGDVLRHLSFLLCVQTCP